MIFESPRGRDPLPWTRWSDPATTSAWRDIVVAQGADVVVLDGVLAGERIHEIASPACCGRLVLGSADWTDSFALLDHLTARGHVHHAVADRLQAVLQIRRVTLGVAPGAPAAPRGACTLSEVLFVTDALRAALHAGAPAAALRQIATRDGFRPLRERAREAVASGHITADEAIRALG